MSTTPTETQGVETVFGFVPRFVSRHGTQHESILEALERSRPVSLDYEAINTFLRLGMFLNGGTPFAGIKRVCPEPVIVPPVDIDRSAAIEGYIDLFRQAVRRRLSENAVAGLSGGCDSRHILFELCREGALPDMALTVAIPDRPSEPVIAARVARAIGAAHEIVTLDPANRIPDEEWKNHRTDFMSQQHYWFLPLARRAVGRPCWDGIAGDVLSAGLFLEEWNLGLYEKGRLDELAERMVPQGRVPWRGRDQSMFPREPVVAELRVELDKHAGAANPVGSFFFWNRTRVDIAASAFGLLQNTLAPYLDTDLWRFLASLPARMMLDHRLHIDTIARAFPEFEEIPYWDKRELEECRKTMRNEIILDRLLLYCLRHGAFLDAARCLRGRLRAAHADGVHWLLPIVVWREGVERALTAPAVVRG